MLTMATKKYYVPYAEDINYKSSLLKVLNTEKPDLIHFQNDIEIREASRMREDIINMGAKIYMPTKEVIEVCVDKGKSSLIWESEGIKIPKTIIVNNEKDFTIINLFYKNDTVIILPLDNMPCYIPDMSKVSKMPNLQSKGGAVNIPNKIIVESK